MRVCIYTYIHNVIDRLTCAYRCVGMYVCMYVWYVCMYVCLYVCINVCMHVRKHVRIPRDDHVLILDDGRVEQTGLSSSEYEGFFRNTNPFITRTCWFISCCWVRRPPAQKIPTKANSWLCFAVPREPRRRDSHEQSCPEHLPLQPETSANYSTFAARAGSRPHRYDRTLL